MAVERLRTTAQATEEGLRVFVAGLPWNCDEETIRRDFEECGVIEDLFLLRDQDGNSKGRCFITYQEKSAVDAALLYDNTAYGGRKVFVKIAEGKRKAESAGTAQEPKQSKAKEAVKAYPDEKPEGCRSLCLKNIGNATEVNVRKFLDGCSVQACRIVLDRVTGEPRGIAFVDFRRGEDVDKAMEKNGQELKDQVVEMHYEAPRQRPRPEGCMTVAIKKLPTSAGEAEVRRLFNGLKSIKDVRVIMKDGACTGLAFVEFTDEADVVEAARRDGMKVKGEVVFICYETKAKKDRPQQEKKSEAGAPNPAKSARAKARRDKKKAAAKSDKSAGQEAEAAPDAQEEAGAEKGKKRKLPKKQRAKKGEEAKVQEDAESGKAGKSVPEDEAGTAAAPGAARKNSKTQKSKRNRKNKLLNRTQAEAEVEGDGGEDCEPPTKKAKTKKAKKAKAEAA